MIRLRNFYWFIFLILFALSCGKDPFGNREENLLPRSQVKPMEDRMFALVNADRSANGLPAFEFNEQLRTVAVQHSEDMYVREFFSHTNPDGDTPSDRISSAGILYSSCAENIARNSGYTDPVKTAQDSLMASPGHRANLLGPYTQIGIGIATDGDVYYYTQVFIVPRASHFLFNFQNVESRDGFWRDPFETFDEFWSR